MVAIHNLFKSFQAFVLCVALGASASSCSSSEGSASETAAQSVAAVPTAVETVTADKNKLVSTLSIPGELISFQHVDLYAREASFVKDIFVDVGSKVNSGQVLATLEAPEISSRLAGAQSRLKSSEAVYLASKASYERLVATSKTPGTISPNDLDQARAKVDSDLAQLESAKASVKEAGTTLSYLTIRAPFSGVITARNINRGAYVGTAGRASGDPLFVLQEQHDLRLVVSVPEAYSPYLSIGDEVRFGIKGMQQRIFKAKVTRMAGALDSKLRSERVEMDVVNDEGKLLPGMIVNVNFTMTGDSVIIAPASAVVNSQERIFVIKIKDGRATWVDVSLGRKANGNIEIFGDVRAGDILVKKASDEIRNGESLTIAEPKK
jgi:membrane fusion protein, multidrug efflux system